MKIVYNNDYGGFSISKEALDLYYKLGGNKQYDERSIPRTDPLLVLVVETLGNDANGMCAKLKIKEMPDDYPHCYVFNEDLGKEKIILDPAKLIAYKLHKLDINKLSDVECRQTLIKLRNLSK